MQTTKTIRIVAVPGSGRRGSLNKLLVEAAASRVPVGAEIDVFADFARIPVFNEDLESQAPDAIVGLRSMLSGADALLISTPEYNQSVPGGVKNVVDWLSRSGPGERLVGRPVAVTGVTTGRWGTRISQSLLRQMLLSTGAFVLPEPQLFVSGGDDVFNGVGTIVDDGVAGRLTEFLSAFVEWIRLVRNRGL